MDSLSQEERNQQLVNDLLTFLMQNHLFTDTTIYFNGKRISDSSFHHPNAKPIKTKYGTYYDCGKANVHDYLEPDYANPNAVSMTFEGPLYMDYNGYAGTCSSYNKIQHLCEKYGLYAEQGYAWSLTTWPL